MIKRNNRYKRLIFLPLFILLVGCVELYDFVIEDESPYLVVEGYISDASFNETLTYPSDGRYFTVKLSYTSEVTNVWGQDVSGAIVKLIDSEDNTWYYTEVYTDDRPVYQLLDNTFEAESGREYKLHVTLPDENIFESEWVSLPSLSPEVGEVNFTEEDKDGYDYIRGEKEVVTIKGITASVELPEHNQNDTYFYKWTFDPTYIVKTPYDIPDGSPIPAYCYVTNKYFLNVFTLQEDITGGYQQDLFFLEVIGNESMDDWLSVLIVQQSLNKEYFFFWQELKESNSGNPIIEKQPFNLATNFKSVNSESQVAGYFDVVSEKATRWYFNHDMLSYDTEDAWASMCALAIGPGPPPDGCENCLEYPKGIVTDQKPSWWNPN
ncbi:DUF4249 family protein [Mangrovivirga cuniculi]|uniref:DUF4249 domain-containing protein n=1 Tax=Mangrovivirga cuniculi TaxID=2715131 RepID=A0A4D7JU54_9BACT|nr:DUF4249 family protein [Mangrovivirga cuniculi]QCK15706.1 hypothetical protein DCC35_13610 [Mangrovivirga cuniculi]